MKRILISLSFSTLFAAVLLACFNRAGLFEVNTIPVRVNVSQTTAVQTSQGPSGLQARLEAQVKKFAKKKIWEIDLGAVKSSIAGDEWVKDVLISRTFPNHIQINVTPKKTALVYVNAKGELVPITEDGTALHPLQADSAPDVPVLRGEVFARDADKRAQAIQFVKEMPEEGVLSKHNVSEISWTSEEGFSVTLMQPKLEVKMGEDHLSMKVLRVGQVLNYLSANSLRGRVIDASFSKKVLVRLRKDP